MPPQLLTSHHHIPTENQPVERDLDRQEIIQSEPEERETPAVQPTETQQQPPAVQEAAPPHTPKTSDRPRRSNAGKTRKYDDFVMCNCKLKCEASASKRRLRDSPSPGGGGRSRERYFNFTHTHDGSSLNTEMPCRQSKKFRPNIT